ncbi:OLC1v1006799C1 [Oldenlandia corymbosa var. corymbosa]|uniref:OLC1v1006799C1 n=1 Tax=Oldenlandia corymbosa var. corymbosa TaxID=529605 RepID=A0AAV1DIH5_OLDCO|nr:OLC1v1006799C1 [Oldenlandia corymbosa var. corymbosa]
MKDQFWRWVLGLVYIFAVAAIWIAASFVVQSVVDAGVSPFLITYICNSLFIIYIPLVELGRFLEDKYGSIFSWWSREEPSLRQLGEETILLRNNDAAVEAENLSLDVVPVGENVNYRGGEGITVHEALVGDANVGLDAKGRWTRARVAKSNTILSSSSSLFTFLVALVFLGENFTWLKLFSVLLCMGGTIIVSLGDSEAASSSVAPNPVLGDILSLLSAAFYAAYITLIRKKLPDEDDKKQGEASMAQFLGFLGLFNLLIFLPIALVLNFAKLEPFKMLSWKQIGLIVGKGLLDNVLSDYLWAKAVLLTSTTVATAGLSIQVPLAAVVDTITGNTPHLLDYAGAAAVMVGFAGINIPSEVCSRPDQASLELGEGNLRPTGQEEHQ